MATPTSLGGVSLVPLTGQNYIDSLLDYYKWGGSVGTGAVITYSFRSNSSLYSTGVNEYGPPTGSGEPWKSGWLFLTDTQKIGIAAALNAWAEVANLTFTEVIDSSTVAGDIRFSTEPGIPRSHTWLPWQSARAGDVWFTTSSNLNTSVKGTYGYLIFLHEIGHALGLDHPHDGRAIAASSIDALPFSVMSYQDYVGDTGDTGDSGLLPTTPMLNDIAAIQYLYGANMATRSGNTTYSWTVGQSIYETIWDGGGNDTIDWSNQFSAATINLNAGQWSYLGPTRWDGHAYTQQNLAIAYNVTIENAIGGNGPDTIIGNDAANSLIGGSGADTISGGAGDDSIEGGDGNDRLDGGPGNDRFDWNASNRAGDDTFVGGPGDDVYVISGSDQVIENSGEGTDTIWASTNFSVANMPNVENLFLFGTDPVSATGNALSNVIRGTSANNVLDGGTGADILVGGAGNDRLDGGAGIDTAVYSSNRAAYTISGAGSTISGPEGADTLANIERFQFSDKNLAFDLGPNQAAGNTVRIIGAAFDGPTIQQHPEFVGIGLQLFDGGMSLQQVCAFALGSPLYLSLAGSSSNTAFVNTVYRNVVGVLPSATERGYYVGLLQGSGGSMTQAQLLEIAANADLNAVNINLVGLQQSGVEFI